MARELEIDIIVNSDAAKANLAAVDAQVQRTASSFSSLTAPVTQSDAALSRLSTTTGVVQASTRAMQTATQEYTTVVSVAEIEAAGFGATLNTQVGILGRVREAAALVWQTFQANGIGGVRALFNGLAEDVGLTVGKLGLLGTAGAVLGAGYAGWGIGRMIADVFDLDTKISNLTATMLGWGNLAQETAEAKFGTINIAIARGAALTTTFTEAIKYNTEWVNTHARALAGAASDAALGKWRAELESLTTAGVMAQFTRDIQLNVESTKELAERYHISVEAIALYKDAQQKAAAATRDATKAAIEQSDAMAKHALSIADLKITAGGYITILEHMNTQVASDAKRWLELGASQQDVAEAYGLSEIQIRAVAAALESEQRAAEMDAKTKDQLSRSTAALTAEEQKQLAVTNAAVVAELDAKTKLAARNGTTLGGNALPQNLDPFDAANRAYDAKIAKIRASTPDGFDSSAQQEEATRELQDTFDQLRGTTTQLSQAQSAGAAAVSDAGRAHAAAAPAVTSLGSAALYSAQAANAAGQLFQGTGGIAGAPSRDTQLAMGPTLDGKRWIDYVRQAGSTPINITGGGGLLPSFDVGGPIDRDGPIYAHAGEMVVPKGGMLVATSGAGGGVSIGDIHIHGNVDSESRASRMVEQVADRVFQKLSLVGGKQQLTR